jgi:uncharacterized protein
MKKYMLALVLLVNLSVCAQPIFEAYERGNYLEIQKLLKTGTSPNEFSKNKITLLFLACLKDDTTMTEILIRNNADVNLVTGTSISPLNAACQTGNVSIVKELISAGANVNYKDANGWSSLITASRNGHLEIVKILVEKMQ